MGFTIPRSAVLEADGPLSLSSLVVLWARGRETQAVGTPHPPRLTPGAAGEAVTQGCQAGRAREGGRGHSPEMHSTLGTACPRGVARPRHTVSNCQRAAFLSEELAAALQHRHSEAAHTHSVLQSTAMRQTLFLKVPLNQEGLRECAQREE